MNKGNKSAAGLRRSAIAERIRLREEWSALKEIEIPNTVQNILKKKPANSRYTPSASNKKRQPTVASSKKNLNPPQLICETLKGVVSLVDIGSEARALPLRAALTALGATVVTEWSPLVTHLIWTDNGARSVRARARALACKLVSPLWVEACAAAGRKLREKLFPAASRQSDLPSPRTLRYLLKKAERENVSLLDLLSDSREDEDKEEMPRLRLRISNSDTSRDKTTDTSNETLNLESRINTAPRGGTAQTTRPTTGATTRPATAAKITRPPPKSRRKLFTHKEAQDISSSDEESDSTRKRRSKLTQSEKRDLARAERMAKKLLAACNTQITNNNIVPQPGFKPRIVLTGMNRIERQAVTKCIQKLGGIIQNSVNKRTTHVLMGSCNSHVQCETHGTDITGVSEPCDLTKSCCWSGDPARNARTFSALAGAARGARVLAARWAVRSAERAAWRPPRAYELQHLRHVSQKARIERTALGLLNSDYAYNIFSGMRVRISDDADQREAAIKLLSLCGAVIQDGRHNDEETVDVVIGNSVDEVHSKWVFDSVASARMRTTRRYVSMNSLSLIEQGNT